VKEKIPRRLFVMMDLNACVPLPIAHRKIFVDGLSLDELLATPDFQRPVKRIRLSGWTGPPKCGRRMKKRWESAIVVTAETHLKMPN
jgi:hypothetical protein